MIEIKQAVKAKVMNVSVLSQKNRAVDENPGAKLRLKVPLSVDQLEMLAPGSTKEWFEEVKTQPKQQALDGVEQARSKQLSGLGLILKKAELSTELTGYTITIVRGTGRAESNLILTDCTILKGSAIELHETGAYWTFNADTPNASDADWGGKLPRLKSTSQEMLLAPPVVAQEDLDLQAKRDSIPPAPQRKPGAAERAAVAKNGGQVPPAAPHKGEAKAPRTARGKEATRKALEEGAAAAAGKGGKPGAPPASDAATKAFLDAQATKH